MVRKIVASLIAIVAFAFGFYFFAHRSSDQLPTGTTIDRIVVEKAKRELSIFRAGTKLKSYRVALGRNPVGAKQEEGDMKTPEGVYSVDGLKSDSDYHLALHLSYPSPDDTARAAARGVSAGGDIEIHGLPNGGGMIGSAHRTIDWTAGCIAVTNEEIDELYRVTPVGTAVEIRP